MLALALTLGGPAFGAAPGSVAGLGYEVTASSVPSKQALRFGARNLRKLDPARAWCAGSSDNAWLELDMKGAAEPVEVANLVLKILPGHMSPKRLYVTHARPASMTVTVTERATGTPVTPQDSYRLSVPDQRQVHVYLIPVDGTVVPGELRVRLSVDEVYRGNTGKAPCITEVRVFLDQPEGNVSTPSYAEQEALRVQETAYLTDSLPRANAGDRAAMQGLIRLAEGAYIETAEGGEWLNEIYLDLLVRHPESFLQLVDLQEEQVTKGVVTELLAPVTDKYAREDLLAAVRQAKSAGLTAPFVDELAKVYALPRVEPRPAPVPTTRKAPGPALNQSGADFVSDLGPT